MDESLTRRRAGTGTALGGALLLALWLLDRLGLLTLPGESVRLFLLIVGTPLLFAGVLLARSDVGTGTNPPGERGAEADQP